MKILELFNDHWHKLLNILLILIALFALFVFVTSSQWWRKLGNSKVLYNGQNAADSGVYRSPNGDFLVYLKDLPYERSLFIVYPTENNVGLPNENQFLFFPWYAYSKNVSPPVVFMNSAKVETNPKLVIKPNTIEFTTSAGGRVLVLLD